MALEKSLIPASSIWATQQNCGWSNTSTVSVTGQDGRSFCLVKPSRWTSCSWKYQLVEGPTAEGSPALHITKGGHKSTVMIYNPKTGQTIEMRSPSFLRRIREFTWEGRHYMWKRSSKMCAKQLTYTLTEKGSSVPLAENAWQCWSWRSRKGNVTIFEAGSHLPTVLVIAMGLAMEELWLESQHSGSSGGYSGG